MNIWEVNHSLIESHWCTDISALLFHGCDLTSVQTQWRTRARCIQLPWSIRREVWQLPAPSDLDLLAPVFIHLVWRRQIICKMGNYKWVMWQECKIHAAVFAARHVFFSHFFPFQDQIYCKYIYMCVERESEREMWSGFAEHSWWQVCRGKVLGRSFCDLFLPVFLCAELLLWMVQT